METRVNVRLGAVGALIPPCKRLMQVLRSGGARTNAAVTLCQGHASAKSPALWCGKQAQDLSWGL